MASYETSTTTKTHILMLKWLQSKTSSKLSCKCVTKECRIAIFPGVFHGFSGYRICGCAKRPTALMRMILNLWMFSAAEISSLKSCWSCWWNSSSLTAPNMLVKMAGASSYHLVKQRRLHEPWHEARIVPETGRNNCWSDPSEIQQGDHFHRPRTGQMCKSPPWLRISGWDCHAGNEQPRFRRNRSVANGWSTLHLTPADFILHSGGFPHEPSFADVPGNHFGSFPKS